MTCWCVLIPRENVEDCSDRSDSVDIDDIGGGIGRDKDGKEKSICIFLEVGSGAIGLRGIWLAFPPIRPI